MNKPSPLPRLHEVDAEMIGGAMDGFKFRRVSRKPTCIGSIMQHDGEAYRCLGFKNNVAQFHFVKQGYKQ